MTIDGIKLKFRNAYIRITSKMRGKKILNRNFTIISNNCWGGLVYESYGLEKQTPTVGMFFMPEEYIRFVSNLKHYTQCEMTFVEPDESRHKDFYKIDSRFGTYPIARVDDIEIALLHFHSKEEAKLKWERRCKRINWDNMLIKMNDQNQCKFEHVKDFISLSHKNKVFFTVKKNWKMNGVTVIESKNTDCCGLFDEPFGASKKLNVNQLINELN